MEKKMPLNSPLRRKASSAQVSASDDIPTPETGNTSANPSNLPRSDCELQQKSKSSSDSTAMSSAARKTTTLPENFEMLAEFFNCLDSSIRLLRLKGASSTFTKISASIKHLTERRFTYSHLAQLKHILPEAISIKKVLLCDEATCCMKPELQVSLRVDAVESNLKLKGESPYSTLKKVFRDRLLQFAREHPEEYDIPEETLPHPFGLANSSMSI